MRAFRILKNPTDQQLIDRFNWKVGKPTASGCRLWQGSKDERGYGHMRAEGHVWKAHRLSYTLFVGPVPLTQSVCHRCDIPSCIEPTHLFLGTHLENMQDMRRKGRARVPRMRGTEHHWGKFSDEIVQLVRESQESYSKISAKYGVSPSWISWIKNGKARIDTSPSQIVTLAPVP